MIAEEEAYRAQDTSLLRCFLGGEFGVGQFPFERWLRIKGNYGPFGWVKTYSDGVRGVQSRLDAVRHYILPNGPAALLVQAQHLAKRVAKDTSIPLTEVSTTNCLWKSEGANDRYILAVSVSTNCFETSTTNVYQLKLEVVNKPLNTKARQLYPSEHCDWIKVFPPTLVPVKRQKDSKAWAYLPPVELPTEKALELAIARKDEAAVPHRAGYPGIDTIRGETRYQSGCSEAEADGFCVDYIPPYQANKPVGFFFRYCSEADMHRWAEMAARPHKMRPRQPGEIRYHQDGNIDGDVQPGDKLRWTTPEGDWKNGVACTFEEAGEWVHAFKCRAKDVSITYHARPEDFLPTPATSNYLARSEEVKRRARTLDCFRGELPKDPQLRRQTIREALAWIHAQERDGLFTLGWYSGLAPLTREEARASVRRQERQALSSWQNRLQRLVEDLVRTIRRDESRALPREGNWQPHRQKLVTIYGLTRYEWARLCGDPDWVQFHASTVGSRFAPGYQRAARGPMIASETPDEYASFAVSQTRPFDRALAEWVALKPEDNDRAHTRKTLALWVLVNSLFDRQSTTDAQWRAVWKMALERPDDNCTTWVLRQLVLERLLDDRTRVLHVVSLVRTLVEKSSNEDVLALLDILARTIKPEQASP